MGGRSQWQVGTITLKNEYFMKIIKHRQFATVDPATEEVITMVAEADRLASRSFSCLLEYKGCSHNLSDVRTTIFTNNGTSSSTIFENLLREIRKKKKSIKSLQTHAFNFLQSGCRPGSRRSEGGLQAGISLAENGRKWARSILILASSTFLSFISGRLLNTLANLMERDKQQLAGLDTLDNGKPLPSAVEDVEQSISTFQ